MTAADALFVLHDWSHERGHALACPNIYLFHGESDLVCVTKAGLAVEIEVKLTLADYRNELAYLGEREAAGSDEKWLKHTLMAGKAVPPRRFHSSGPTSEEERRRRIPAQYFIAAPRGVVPVSMLPAHAGLIEFGPRFEPYGPTHAAVVKKAPHLHRDPITPQQWQALARSMAFRFWRERSRARHTKSEKNETQGLPPTA